MSQFSLSIFNECTYLEAYKGVIFTATFTNYPVIVSILPRLSNISTNVEVKVTN